MQLDQLKTFCFIVEEKSFSRAAVRMFITQPAVSMQIRSLEEEIGQALVERGKKKIYPTEAGRILYSYAKNVFTQIESARNKIDDIKKLVRGHLTIGCSDTVSSYFLPSVLSEFLKKYPSLEITVMNRPSSHIIQMVLERTADIGIITMPANDDNLKTKRLFKYRNIALCSVKHPIAQFTETDMYTLAKHRLLLLEPGTKNRMFLDKAFTKAGVVPRFVMEFGSVEVQKSFAKAGTGIAIVPDFSVKSGDDDKLVKRLNIKGSPELEVGVVYRKSRELSPAARKFLERLNM